MPYTNGVWRPHEWRDWEIELVNSDLQSAGMLDEAVGASVLWAQYGHGDGSMALHINSELATDLLNDGMFYMRCLRDGAWLRDFMLAKDDRGYTVSNQYVDEHIEISLSPLDAVLRGKQVFDSANPASRVTTPDLPIDDGFTWLVDQTCGPNAMDGPGGVSRVLPGLVVQSYQSAHAESAEIDLAHKMDLFEFLQKYGPTWGVDWRVRLVLGAGGVYQMVFETIYPAPGLDKTVGNGARAPILVNDASGEVRQAKRHRPATGFANVIISKNLQSEVQDAASVALYGRRELIADTNDPQRMEAILLERKQRLGYEVVFTESEMMSLGQGASADGQFGLGDQVTVAVQHLDLPAANEYVKEVRFKLQGVPETATVVFGEHEKTLPEKVSESGGSGDGVDYLDPLLGLTVGATTVHFGDDDPSTITLVAGTGVSLTPNDGAGTITIEVTPGVSLLGNGSAQWQSLVTGGSPHAPVWTLLRSDVRGATKEAPLKSDSSGELALVALDIGSYGRLYDGGTAGEIVLAGTSYATLFGGTGWVVVAATAIYPQSGLDLGKTANPFGNGYFSGDVIVASTGKGLVMNINTSGLVLVGNGQRFRPMTPSITGHTGKQNFSDYSVNRDGNPLRVKGAITAVYVPYWTSAQSFTHVRVADNGSGSNERWLAVTVGETAVGSHDHWHQGTTEDGNLGIGFV